MKHEELINKMTLDEKASLLSGKNFWETMDIPSVGLKSMFLSDGPHGMRKQIEGADHLGLNQSVPATCFPTSATIANSFDLELVKRVGKALGEEALSLNVNVVLGPGLNIKRNPRCGRNFEYYSEDPYLAGKLGAAYVKGIQSNGIGSCIKHFACNNQEERRLSSNSVLDIRTLREIYTTAFEMAIKEAHPLCIMSSYNLVNDTYTNENNYLLREVLRRDFGFDGVVVTDWGGNNDRVAGLIAGDDIEMPGNNGQTDKEVIEAVKNNKINESLVNESVDRILTLYDKTMMPFENGKKYTFDINEHHKIAEEAASESIVLLKNDNSVLPLDNDKKVCFIGDFANTPRYQGAGSSIVNPTKLDSALDKVKEFQINFIGYEQGYKRDGKNSNKLAKKALELGKKSDVIVYFMGLDEIAEAEGLERKNILINQNQIELLKELHTLNKKIVVILSEGSVVDLSFDKYCDGLVFGCLSGQAGAGALLKVLTGKVNPSGKLSETYPLSYKDTPTKNYFPSHEFNSLYKDGLYVGYRYFEKVNKQVKYPFGFGLSYTKFDYQDLQVSNNGVSFKIKNIGSVKGKEIAQLYIGLKSSKIFRPVKELKGFIKIELEPGETKEVTINFDEYSFRFFNVKDGKFEIEKGTYDLYIGASSQDIRLTGKIDVDGIDASGIYNPEKLPHYYSGEITNINNDEFETLIERKIPESHVKFTKKNRIIVDYNVTINELKYSKGRTGRLTAWGVNFAIKFLRKIGKKTTANTVVMGVLNQPMRCISRMTGGAITWDQLNALMYMFNGHFHKGLGRLIKATWNRPKVTKENHYTKVKKK